MKVQVTQDDIDFSLNRPKDEIQYCPIENALIRQGYEEVSVSRRWARFGGKEIELPLEAREFIGEYDAGLKVEPFEFELDGESNNE